MKKTLRIGSRKSLLALAQVEEIMGTKRSYELMIYDTKGDRDRKTPLTANLPDNFFTDTLDQALLKKEIDLAIHSAKDLPKELPEGLSIFALTKSLDDTDAFVGRSAFRHLKKGARIGTSSPLRQEMIKKLNPKLKPVHIRGDIEARLKQLDDGQYDGVIMATCALKRLGLKKRIKEIMPWEATALQGQLAVVGRSKDTALAEQFSNIDVRQRYGTVYLVGAGPGDPELFTVKGINLLKKCDVVFYDYLISKDLLQYAKSAKKIYVGKRKGKHSLPQDALNKQIRKQAQKGKMVVRLKGGDPLIFGRGADEIDYLRSYHIDVEVIPGVSSATAIPSDLGIPLTARGVSDSVAFLSGHKEGESVSQRKKLNIPKAKTLVFLMGLTKLKEIVRQLKKDQWNNNTPVIVISKGTCKDEKIVGGKLSDIISKVNKERLDPPALIIVGETVRFYHPKTKNHKTILYTGTNPKKYQHRGNLIHIPMLAIRARKLTKKQIAQFMRDFKDSDYLLFTSRFAVQFFFDVLKRKWRRSSFESKKIIAIGKVTAEALRKRGLKVHLVSKDESSEGLFKAIKNKLPLEGKKILFPRSILPNPYLKNALKKAGAKVKAIAVYENKKPAKKDLPRRFIDEVIFTSPSTVKNFLKDYGTIPRIWKVKSRGKLTQKSLKKAGFESDVIDA